MPDPHGEYSRRLEARRATMAGRERQHRRVGNAKLAILIGGLALAWIVFGKQLLSPYWLLIPLVAYLGLGVMHELILRGRTRAERAATFYSRGIARLEDRWAGSGEPGDRFRDEKHIYAEDLDLFGRGSLFELLCSARTPMGENWLAGWLLGPGRVAEVTERQSTVAELRGKLDLREDLALVGEDLRVRLNPEALARWAESGRVMPGAGWQAAAALLVAAAVGTLAWGILAWNYWPFGIVLLIEALFRRRLRDRIHETVTGLDSSGEGLDLFAGTLGRLEAERFASERLRRMIETLKQGGRAASLAVRRLARIAYWIDARDSFMIRLVDIPLLYSVHVGFAAENWRRRRGAEMRAWIDIVGEMEALVSLAAYSAEHPGDPFPEFGEGKDGEALFHGEELGHPLIPTARCVRNSVRLDGKAPVLMVSGSNMSGKSTLLRVTGVNAVLAMAGAPIRGKSLRLSPLAVGTRLRSSDSLQENRSGFYTEILRIRQVFDRTEEEMPVLFLFDELMEGTNSRDRRIGAEGLLGALADRGAIGIVTTHDLALTEITTALGSAVVNAHFQDYVEDGQMRFDYKLRPGVVARSNALELMRLIGLRV